MTETLIEYGQKIMSSKNQNFLKMHFRLIHMYVPTYQNTYKW